MPTIPGSPDLSPQDVKTLFNLKTDEDAQRVLDLAVEELDRALTGAVRDVPPVIYTDLVRRVCGAVVGTGKRPASPGGAGQLTTVQAQQPVAVGDRDYLAPVRHELAQYVVSGL